ncbi:MAG: PqqD family protein [Oscillospiraceae bacterium]|jgi:hypothetical protein|nr:PqqD family protein [Oscillospiraceae bacterium]MBQ2383366.1 PqqD family protein [Oscillospiraceae bacterium]MBQ5711557.1 PqqD family protein [Oscillospiraceae bacterium]
MKIKKRMIKRQIGGETFLVPLGKAVYDSNGLYFLTEVGAFIWDLLPQAEDEDQIVAAVLDAYDAEEATVRADVAEFVEKLRGLEIL